MLASNSTESTVDDRGARGQLASNSNETVVRDS
jgi:hypothetical protein